MSVYWVVPQIWKECFTVYRTEVTTKECFRVYRSEVATIGEKKEWRG